jgi:hypothetical protein
MNLGMLRTRWAAVGAAVAVTLGAGSIGIGHATSPAGAAVFVPITPCRLVDTRPAPDTVGARTTPLGPGETITLAARGDNGNCTSIPTTATGLELNVTALGATSGTFLTIWATGATRPTASNLNPQPGAPPIPNSATTGLSGGGAFDVYNAVGSVHVLVDVVGYYADHHHDDRYYTKSNTYSKSETYSKSQLDAALATKDDVQAAIDGANRVLAISTVDQVVASVTVRTPTNGYVIVNSAATAKLGGGTIARCSITNGNVIDEDALQEETITTGTTHSLSGTRGFVVDRSRVISPAIRTYNLVCDAQSTGWNLNDPYLTAVFIPDPDPVEPDPFL